MAGAATGEGAFSGDLVVEGNRIAAVAKGGGADTSGSDTVIDATGKFCMPGMTEGHGHISFENVTATASLEVLTEAGQTLAQVEADRAALEPAAGPVDADEIDESPVEAAEPAAEGAEATPGESDREGRES